MRMMRVLAGVALIAGGVLALTGGTARWILGIHRTDGAFEAQLAPVHSDGYAVVVPDVLGVVAEHGVGRLLGDGQIRIQVRADYPLVGTLGPANDVSRYIFPTSRTEIAGVGYAAGPQPVRLKDLGGGPVADEQPWPVVAPGQVLTASTEGPRVALMLLRADRGSGFTVTITAGLVPNAWSAENALLLVTGLLAVVMGALLLVLRKPPTPSDGRAAAWARRRLAKARALRWIRRRRREVLPTRAVEDFSFFDSPLDPDDELLDVLDSSDRTGLSGKRVYVDTAT